MNSNLGSGLRNTDKNGITSYPVQVGCYRVIHDVVGLPNGSGMYGVLFLVDGGTYIMHLFIDAFNVMYWCRTNGFGTPISWEKATSTSVTAIS